MAGSGVVVGVVVVAGSGVVVGIGAYKNEKCIKYSLNVFWMIFNDRFMRILWVYQVYPA